MVPHSARAGRGASLRQKIPAEQRYHRICEVEMQSNVAATLYFNVLRATHAQAALAWIPTFGTATVWANSAGNTTAPPKAN